ncbi:MAG: nucleotidyltransferase domain-containing protein [Candidatus Aenigmatarchaeota archaeon]
MNLLSAITNMLRKLAPVKAVYLFGSAARGTQMPFSDIDICVITDEKIAEQEKLKIISCSSERVDVVVWHDLPVTMRYRILKEGKLLFARDRKTLHTAAVETISEYLDYKPLLERFSEAYFGDRNWINNE